MRDKRLQIGPYHLSSNVLLAPMAGVTDLPFRSLCRTMGAGLVTSEMITCDPSLRNSRKSLQRQISRAEPEPRSVQIAGGDAHMLADAARYNVDLGAQIIDINMGCPAKKVCKKAAGSALMKDEALVADILNTVCKAVSVPVTLKIRLGWSKDQENALTIANIAEQAGIQALAIHGRTRACKFSGEVNYDAIAAIKQTLSIPVIANGDIDSPEKAASVLKQTGADGIMIGRAAQGQPWIFQQTNHLLIHGKNTSPPSLKEQQAILLSHLEHLHEFYGEFLGSRIARKHVAWYLQNAENQQVFRAYFNRLDNYPKQVQALHQFFESQIQQKGKAA